MRGATQVRVSVSEGAGEVRHKGEPRRVGVDANVDGVSGHPSWEGRLQTRRSVVCV